MDVDLEGREIKSLILIFMFFKLWSVKENMFCFWLLLMFFLDFNGYLYSFSV